MQPVMIHSSRGVFEVSTLQPSYELQLVLQHAASRSLSRTFYSSAVRNLWWFCLAVAWLYAFTQLCFAV